MESFNEQIIELVKENPCLYDKKDNKYKDVKYKEKIWENIAKQINLNVKECKIKWKSLRDRFRKQKMAENLPSGSYQKIGAPWKYMQSMEFLSESLEPAGTIGNICDYLDLSLDCIQDGSSNQSETINTVTTQSNKKRKTDDLFIDVLMAMKSKYTNPQPSSTGNYESFFAMLKEKFDRLQQNEIDDVQLEILQLVNRKINK